MVTDKAVLGGAAFFMAREAEAHVDFVHRLDPVHLLDRTMTLLAGDPGPDMRLMREAYEVGQRVHPVPADLKGRLRVVGPGPCHRLEPAGQRVALASHAALHRRHARGLRTARILVAVLARDLVDPGVDAMAERDGLLDVLARSPRPLREGKHRQTAEKRRQGDGYQYPVHLVIQIRFSVASPWRPDTVPGDSPEPPRGYGSISQPRQTHNVSAGRQPCRESAASPAAFKPQTRKQLTLRWPFGKRK